MKADPPPRGTHTSYPTLKREVNACPTFMSSNVAVRARIIPPTSGEHIQFLPKPSSQVNGFVSFRLVDSYQEMSKSVPVRVTSLKTGPNEPEIHVMMFDMEALICHLLVEETKMQKSESFTECNRELKIYTA